MFFKESYRQYSIPPPRQTKDDFSKGIIFGFVLGWIGAKFN
jgi:hypothetical protein